MKVDILIWYSVESVGNAVYQNIEFLKTRKYSILTKNGFLEVYFVFCY